MVPAVLSVLSVLPTLSVVRSPPSSSTATAPESARICARRAAGCSRSRMTKARWARHTARTATASAGPFGRSRAMTEPSTPTPSPSPAPASPATSSVTCPWTSAAVREMVASSLTSRGASAVFHTLSPTARPPSRSMRSSRVGTTSGSGSPARASATDARKAASRSRTSASGPEQVRKARMSSSRCRAVTAGTLTGSVSKPRSTPPSAAGVTTRTRSSGGPPATLRSTPTVPLKSREKSKVLRFSPMPCSTAGPPVPRRSRASSEPG